MPVQQVEELRLQRRARAPAVEVGEERILAFLEHRGRVEPRRETFGERGLADADWSFDRDRA